MCLIFRYKWQNHERWSDFHLTGSRRTFNLIVLHCCYPAIVSLYSDTILMKAISYHFGCDTHNNKSCHLNSPNQPPRNSNGNGGRSRWTNSSEYTGTSINEDQRRESFPCITRDQFPPAHTFGESITLLPPYRTQRVHKTGCTQVRQFVVLWSAEFFQFRF